MLINDFAEKHMNTEINSANINQNVKRISLKIETI